MVGRFFGDFLRDGVVPVSDLRPFQSQIGRAMRVALLVLAVGSTACFRLSWKRAASPDPALIAERVYAFMLCEECSGGEQADLTALGNNAVPLLRTTLVSGPPQDQLTLLRQRLTSANPMTTPPPSQAAIALQLADFDALYRGRAAVALGAIGSGSAKQALCAGRGTPSLRRDTYRKIDIAIARIGGACP